MRRKEKEILDRAQIDGIIAGAPVCRLAMIDGQDPYIVPLCFGYDGKALYVHSAPEGRKIEALRCSDRVCFEIDSGAELVRGPRACRWGMRYASVIGFGRAVFVTDPEAKRRALALIMAHYADGVQVFADAEVAATAVIRVDIGEMTAKRSL